MKKWKKVTLEELDEAARRPKGGVPKWVLRINEGLSLAAIVISLIALIMQLTR